MTSVFQTPRHNVKYSGKSGTGDLKVMDTLDIIFSNSQNPVYK